MHFAISIQGRFDMFGYNEKVLFISTGSYYGEGDTSNINR